VASLELAGAAAWVKEVAGVAKAGVTRAGVARAAASRVVAEEAALVKKAGHMVAPRAVPTEKIPEGERVAPRAALWAA